MYYAVYYRRKGTGGNYMRLGHDVLSARGKGIVHRDYKFTAEQANAYLKLSGGEYEYKVKATTTGDLYRG